jgi:soluble lytic murein transglycosylase
MDDFESVLSMINSSMMSSELKLYHEINALSGLKKYGDVLGKIDNPELQKLGPLAEKILYLKASAMCRSGKSEEGLKIIDSDTVKGNRIVSKEMWTLLKAECLFSAGREDDAVRQYEKITQGESEEVEIRETALIKLAEIEKKKNEKKHLREFTISYPENPAVYDLWENALSPDSFSEAEKILIIKKLFREREYEKIEKWYDFLKQDSSRKEAEYYIGVGVYRIRLNYEKALKHLLIAREEHDHSGAHAYYLSCITMAKLGKVDDAIKCSDDFFKNFSGDQFAVEMGYQKARFAYGKKDYKNAVEYMETFLNRHKNLPDRSKYYWFLGWFYFRAGKDDDALKVFNELAGSVKTLVGDKARYWIGRILEKQGKQNDAVKTYSGILLKYPYSYYSLLSSIRLAKLGQKLPSFMNEDFSSVKVPEEPDWTIFKKADKTIRSAAENIRMLLYAGEIDAGRDIYEKYEKSLKRMSKNRADFTEVMDMIFEKFAGERPGAFGAPDACTSKPVSLKTLSCWRRIFPLAYRELAVHASQKYSFPEHLLYSHMLQESRYNPRAVSGALAFGVLQILRRTGRIIASEIGDIYRNSRLYFPEFSVKWGCYYLSLLTKDFGGQIPFASASYNGGPLLMREQLAKNPGLPFDELIEEIDAHETRNYVRKVMEHYHRYLHLYVSPKERKVLLEKLMPDPVNYTFPGKVIF